MLEKDIFKTEEVKKRLVPCKYCGTDPNFTIKEETTPRSEPYVHAWINCPQCGISLCTKYIGIVLDSHPKELDEAIDKIVDIWNNGNSQ